MSIWMIGNDIMKESTNAFFSRIKSLNSQTIKYRKFVLYWMQSSQRDEYNQALEYSIFKANSLNVPLLVFFGLTDNYPEAAYERHYYFMLEGLREVASSLEKRGIKIIIHKTSPEIGILKLANEASFVVVDRGYLKVQKKWRHYVAERIDIPLIQVESDVIVPVEIASPKEEYAAATFRHRIRNHIENYLSPVKISYPKIDSTRKKIDSLDLSNIEKIMMDLNIDESVKRIEHFRGGTSEAKKHFQAFLKDKLDLYPEKRNDPSLDYLSNMSPYLHFGQISPIYLTLKVLETDSPGKDAFLEELIIRRELSINFVFYNQHYDSFKCLPEWSKRTLFEHENDERKYIYSLKEMENGETHDLYWNAAQREMRTKGKMHGYMRMYWGKKILEWSDPPEKAYKTALYLNNKYELDGRDANGFAGVAWCFGKHDRPWKDRSIFGKIRFMSADGLKRKFNMDGYIKD